MNLQRHQNLLQRDQSAFIVIDMQERFEHVIPDFTAISTNIVKLLKACRQLEIFSCYTEQYPHGLGRTATIIQQEFSSIPAFEKMRFSICGEQPLMKSLADKKIRQIVLTGIETHVCILQSALDLLHFGFEVHLVADATGSRQSCNRDVALERMKQQGVVITSLESVLFEWVEISGTSDFKYVSSLIK
ncbi:MAG: hydrolase [Calditrichaeota bacterium]|nr:MAG: hydrolase [Calditrichota bacterium]